MYIEYYKYPHKLYVLQGNKPIEVSEQQKIYWEGGNKNELVICVGLDSLNNIKWNNTFSWCDAPELEIKIKSHLNENEKLNIPELCNFIENNLNSWKRKEFKDFDYINSMLTVITSYVDGNKQCLVITADAGCNR